MISEPPTNRGKRTEIGFQGIIKAFNYYINRQMGVEGKQ